MTNVHTKEYKCPFCGQEQTEDEMEFDEHDEPAYCFMCGARIINRVSNYLLDDDFFDEPGWE